MHVQVQVHYRFQWSHHVAALHLRRVSNSICSWLNWMSVLVNCVLCILWVMAPFVATPGMLAGASGLAGVFGGLVWMASFKSQGHSKSLNPWWWWFGVLYIFVSASYKQQSSMHLMWFSVHLLKQNEKWMQTKLQSPIYLDLFEVGNAFKKVKRFYGKGKAKFVFSW